MRANTLLGLFGLFASGVLASPANVAAAAEAALVAECGELGVMKVDASELPDGIDISQVRHCAEHPLGRSPGLSPSGTTEAHERRDASAEALEELSSLEPRSCYTAATHGCSGGYCWKQCGLLNTGEWCWTATLAGLGTWTSCKSDAECSTLQSCGIGVCKACGCGC